MIKDIGKPNRRFPEDMSDAEYVIGVLGYIRKWEDVENTDVFKTSYRDDVINRIEFQRVINTRKYDYKIIGHFQCADSRHPGCELEFRWLRKHRDEIESCFIMLNEYRIKFDDNEDLMLVRNKIMSPSEIGNPTSLCFLNDATLEDFDSGLRNIKFFVEAIESRIFAVAAREYVSLSTEHVAEISTGAVYDIFKAEVQEQDLFRTLLAWQTLYRAKTGENVGMFEAADLNKKLLAKELRHDKEKPIFKMYKDDKAKLLSRMLKDEDGGCVIHRADRSYSDPNYKSGRYMYYKVTEESHEKTNTVTVTLIKENDQTHMLTDLVQFIFIFDKENNLFKGDEYDSTITIKTSLSANHSTSLQTFAKDPHYHDLIERIANYIDESGVKYRFFRTSSDLIWDELLKESCWGVYPTKSAKDLFGYEQ